MNLSNLSSKFSLRLCAFARVCLPQRRKGAKRTKHVLSFVLLCLWLIAFETSAAAKENWTQVRSENFTLVGNASEREIRAVALQLEQFRSIMLRLFDRSAEASTVPTIVVVFKNDDAFKPFRPLYQGRLADVAGYFQAGRDQNYISISAGRKGGDPYRTIFHELVHLFIDNSLRGLPLCLNEGLAEYYSSFNVLDGGRRITFGQENASHARLLTNEKELLSLPALLAVDYDSADYNDPERHKLFYAQSWALVHYLSQNLSQKRELRGLDGFTRLLDSLANGLPMEEALKQAFQSDSAEIEKGLKSYIRRQSFEAATLSFEQPLEFERGMQSATISEAAAAGYLGDLLLHINRPDEAESYLQKALMLDPTLVQAQGSLGMLRVRQERLSEAVEILSRAAAHEPQNYLAQYYYAYALSRQGMDGDGTVRSYESSQAALMRAALGRVRELSPRFIEAYRLQAFVNLALNEKLPEAESLLKRALELAPGRQDLLLILAQVHMQQSNFTAALGDLRPVLQRATELKLRERALSLSAEINSALEQAARAEKSAVEREEDATAQAPQSNPASTESSDSASTAEQAHTGRQKLMRRFKGERVRGLLTHIECTGAGGVALFVKVGDRMLRVRGKELRSIFFVTYVAGLERSVTCGARTPENQVVLTYRAAKNPRADFDGEAIAIEFVPEDIDIEP